MIKKEEAFKLFDEGKTPNSAEVIALGLMPGTRYQYHAEWLMGGSNTSPSETEEKPFKIKGEINLGTIDLQTERNKAIEELQETKKIYERQVLDLSQANQALRDRIHEKELEVIKITFQTQLEKLAELINTAPPRLTFLEELAKIREVAEELGYHLPK